MPPLPGFGIVVRGALLAALAVVATAFVVPAAASADIGFKGASWGSLGGSAPASKQSKLWYADGTWWGDLFNGATGKHSIHRLNRTTNAWTDTGTQLDTRTSTRSDVLWDGSANKLYVASNVFKDNTAATGQTDANGNRLFRYSYNTLSDTYTLDAGFPVLIANHTAETLTIDKDSTGRLWATWAAGSKIWVNHSALNNDASWGTPFNVPLSGSVTSDDISSVIAFANKVGVLWSDQASSQMRFAVHTDGADDATWSVANLNTGYSPDDHISMRADTAGNIWAATKTSEGSGSPLILLSKRTPGGTWTHTSFGAAPLHTRPTLLLNEPAGEVHVLATCPEEGASSGQNGGDICTKVASMANPTFTAGAGTSIMSDSAEPDLNDVTSTKQNLTSQSGIVALAGNDTLNYYWHSDRALGGNPPVESAPTASFSATPTSGSAPLNVQFTNTSTGNPAPSSYLWEFGDGTTSTQTSPSHVYAANGSYTVKLTATNGFGSNTKTETGLITVSDAPVGGEQAFTAVADAPVKSSSPTNNYGTDALLRLRFDSSPTGTTYRSYLKFDVSGVSGSVSGAKLRLFSTDGSPDGGRVFGVSNSWTESGITWNNAPAIPATSIGTAGTTTNGSFVDIPLGSAVSGNGTYSFALTTTSSNSQYYSSKESATNKPQLILTTAGGGPPPPPGAVSASFDASATSGQVSLPVTFTDTSTNGPTAWSWSFGDGATSTAQNPSHTYTAAGSYTVSLTATRTSDGSTDTETRTDFITVTDPPPPGTTRTINAIADAHVKNTSPTTNYGTLTTLQVRQGDASNNTTYRTFLKFDVTGASGPVVGAKLRLFVTDASPDGGAIYKTGDAWTETNLTWNTAPVLPASSVASIGSTVAGTWVEIPLGSAITGNGIYSFAIASSSTNSAIYASDESANRPQLILPA